MPTMRHSTHSVTLEVPYERAFAYLADWRTQPEWATNFVTGVREEDRQLYMTTPFGEVPIEWRTYSRLGTIDVLFPGGSQLPTRFTAKGDGSLVYTFSFSMPAEVPEEAFREGQRGMEQELLNLKRILEGLHALHGGGSIPPPCAQLASTCSRGDRPSRPRMTSIAFPGAA